MAFAQPHAHNTRARTHTHTYTYGFRGCFLFQNLIRVIAQINNDATDKILKSFCWTGILIVNVSIPFLRKTIRIITCQIEYYPTGFTCVSSEAIRTIAVEACLSVHTRGAVLALVVLTDFWHCNILRSHTLIAVSAMKTFA